MAPRVSLGVRYIHRDIPEILEDFGSAAPVLLVRAGRCSVEYFVANINAVPRP